MKFSNILSTLVAFGPLLGAFAAPVANTEISSISTRDADLSERSDSLIDARQASGTRVKLQLVAAGGRILQTIIFDYVVNTILPGNFETDSVAWTLNSLSTSPIVQAASGDFFDDPVNGSRLILQFATKALGGIFQFTANAAGAVTGIVSADSFHGTSVGPGEVIKVFNAANTVVASVNVVYNPPK